MLCNQYVSRTKSQAVSRECLHAPWRTPEHHNLVMALFLGMQRPRGRTFGACAPLPRRVVARRLRGRGRPPARRLSRRAAGRRRCAARGAAGVRPGRGSLATGRCSVGAAGRATGP